MNWRPDFKNIEVMYELICPKQAKCGGKADFFDFKLK